MGQRDNEIPELEQIIAGANELQRRAQVIVARGFAFDLNNFQLEVARWAAFNFPKEQNHHLVLGMQEELGELCHCVLKREIGIRGTPEDHINGIKDAIGDFMVFMAQFCNRQGLKIDECIEHAWENVKKRDWITYPHNGKTE